ncbi:odorant receptor 47a-like [Microplitis mediator]|uniref:odorant receptor 47a-like n=1 Tax=Microplitis mediator TaxID=375433 RepID=UPI0025551F14|nr:odorant receptor 47a-like [Microplitis mediator]
MNSKIETHNNNRQTCKSLWNIELIVLQLIGLKSLREAFGREKYHSASFGEKFMCSLGVTVFIIYVFSGFWTLHLVGYEDISYAAEVITVILSATMCMIKGLTLSFHRRQLFVILRDLNILWKDARTRKNLSFEINELIDSSKPARYCYMFAAISVGLSYGLRPYYLLMGHYLHTNNSTIDYSATVYPLLYPFPYHSFISYNLCLIYEQCVNYFAVFYWISCDTIFIQLTTHICIHLLVLGDDFNFRPQNDIKVMNYSNSERVIALSKKHRHILGMCKQVEKLFNPIVFFTILFNGLDLCCCIFTLDKELSEGHWPKFARSVAHAMTLLIQIIIYCNFAHRATELTKNIADSIYNSQWINYDKKVQKLLMITMMRANKEYKFMAYGLLNLDREQMTRIFKTTGSYIALLRSFS